VSKATVLGMRRTTQCSGPLDRIRSPRPLTANVSRPDGDSDSSGGDATSARLGDIPLMRASGRSRKAGSRPAWSGVPFGRICERCGMGKKDPPTPRAHKKVDEARG
jgi:hypothetical protein